MSMDLLEDDTDQTLGTLDSFIDDFPDGGAGELLEESSPKEDEEDTCSLCNEGYSDPRALSCLHTFCKVCLENLLVDESGDNLKINKIIECPKCKQETKVGDKGVAVESIPCGFILRDAPDKVEVPKPIIFCTSCKTQEAARSSCAECASFLCTNCNMAHQFMCCFSEHTVTLLEKQPESTDLAGSCKIHPGQAMGYFCFTCATLTCNACYLASHAPPDHQCEHLSKAEPIARGEITSLVDESKCKVEFYEDAACNLENGLSELQSQRDNAKDLINETFQSYKAILEKQRDHQLEELKKLHTAHELKIMESFHNVEQTMEKIEDACQFSTKLLSRGNPTDILALKATVERQLLNLINNAPKPDVNVALDFETDIEKFEASVKETFGSFRSDKAAVPKETSPSPVAQEPAATPAVGVIGSATASTSPVSLPTSMQSSFEGELAAGFTMPHSVIGQPANISPVSPNNLHNLTTIQEYNLQQLANLAVNVNVKEDQVIPASAAPSPTPSFTLADLFGGDVGSANNALNNLQALAQLGSVALNGASINGDALAARRYHTPTPSPPPTNMPPTLNALINDFANGCGHPMGTNMILGRGDSSSTLEISTPFPMNLSSLSGSPSPNLSDDILSDTMLNGLSSTSNGYHFRTSAGVGKLSPMQIRCKYGQLGPSKGQFNSPHGFCLGADEDIIVADTNNHRIQVFDKVGAYKFQFGMPGKEEGQLWYPRKVAVMRNSGKFVVCDRGNERSRMQIFTKNGHFVKKIAIRYVDIVAGLAVTNQGHIVAVDSVSPTVFVISEAGDLIRWFDCSDYMREPSDIAINGREFFVCDFKGHCVVVFNEEGHFMRRIGAENITNFPNGIDISDAGDVLVGDSHGNRFHVAVFTRSGSLLSEFECPYVKVSRCCGLKITSEGYVVTLAKNNHHVLVLNTLYIH